MENEKDLRRSKRTKKPIQIHEYKLTENESWKQDSSTSKLKVVEIKVEKLEADCYSIDNASDSQVISDKNFMKGSLKKEVNTFENQEEAFLSGARSVLQATSNVNKITEVKQECNTKIEDQDSVENEFTCKMDNFSIDKLLDEIDMQCQQSSTSSKADAPRNTAKMNQSDQFHVTVKTLDEENVQQVSNSPKIHKCDLCEYSSKRKNNLNVHVTSVHLKIHNFRCHYCSYSCNQKPTMKVHIESVHLQLKIHACDECEYRGASRKDLKKHVSSVHLDERKFSCDYCDYNASLKSILQHHIEAVHFGIKKFKCDLCDFSCSRKGALNVHVNYVHLNKRKDFQCDFCEYSASHKGHLKAHVNSLHLKVKNFKCTICEYCTAHKTHLKRHIGTVHRK